jgi:hypothetical protein
VCRLECHRNQYLVLFCFLCINDISVNLRYCRHHLFADDCQIYFSFRPGDVEVGVRSINEDLVASSSGLGLMGLVSMRLRRKFCYAVLRRRLPSSGV